VEVRGKRASGPNMLGSMLFALCVNIGRERVKCMGLILDGGHSNFWGKSAGLFWGIGRIKKCFRTYVPLFQDAMEVL
jgi:hypothetical protein